MESIIPKFNQFVNENQQTNILLNREKVIAEMNKAFSFSIIFSKNREIKKTIQLEDILFAIKPSILFTKDTFLIIPPGFAKIQSYPILEFLNIGGKPCGIGNGNITLNGTIVTVLTRGGKSDMFDLFNSLKKLIKEHLDEIESTVKESKLIRVDKLASQLYEIQKIKIIDISNFKKIIIDNENLIINKGGDKQLFLFMRLDSFLQEFRERIVNDQNGLNDVLDIKWLKSRIIEESKRKDLEKIIENLEDGLASLDGKKTKGFDSNIEKLFDLGNVMNSVMENQIKTIEYYRNMAIAMIIFYLSDKKIRYFEIYEAFEKLGVFDSTWQKNVLNKLESIDNRLAKINNQLTELNQNFISLVQSSENIASELKEINSSIMTNNMLQAIIAYQTWRINKNTKN